MKNVLFLILALIVVSIVWGIVGTLVSSLLGMAFHLAMIGLFCYLVYMVYKAMTNKQKI